MGSYGPLEIVGDAAPELRRRGIDRDAEHPGTVPLEGKGRYSPESLHLQIEAMRRAYLDRARYLGDPDFCKMQLDTSDLEGTRAEP